MRRARSSRTLGVRNRRAECECEGEISLDHSGACARRSGRSRRRPAWRILGQVCAGWRAKLASRRPPTCPSAEKLSLERASPLVALWQCEQSQSLVGKSAQLIQLAARQTGARARGRGESGTVLKDSRAARPMTKRHRRPCSSVVDLVDVLVLLLLLRTLYPLVVLA